MNRKVEAHELDELGILVAQHGSEIPAPVLISVDGTGTGPVTVHVAVDDGSHRGQLGNQVHGIFIHQLGQTNESVVLRNMVGENKLMTRCCTEDNFASAVWYKNHPKFPPLNTPYSQVNSIII